MSESRTSNAFKNVKISLFVQIINILINFVSRTIFIKMLGSEYLGINGLFTNILTVLSFAELGIGNAIIYSMYKPVAFEEKEKIKSLMDFYKLAYRVIGMIKDTVNVNENIILLYVLFLFNTSISYFFTYKKSIISAYQKEYIINLYKLVFSVVQNVIQIVILILTKNFILYLLIQILCTFLNNLLVSIKADKMYPYLKEKSTTSIKKEEKSKIFSNVKSLVLYKIGSVVLNGTDNIIISAFLGVVYVGLYSNYTMIILALTGIIGQCLSSFTGTVGNLNAVGNEEQKEKVLYQLLFISIIIYGFCSGVIFLFINPFIDIWVGSEYVLPIAVVLAVVLHFYINGVQFAAYTYRNTMGLFNKGKLAPIIAAIINIVLSIILCKYLGLFGVLIATSIARLLTTTWIDPYLIYKYEISGKLSKYAFKYILYTILVIINIVVCFFILKFIPESNILYLLIKGIIYTIITCLMYYIFFKNTEEFKELVIRFKNIIIRRKK